MAHPLDDGTAVGLYRDVEPTADSLDAPTCRRRTRVGAFRRPIPRDFDAVRATMLAGFPPIGGPLQLLTQAGPLAAGGSDCSLRCPRERSLAGCSNACGSRAWLLGAAAHGDAPVTSGGSARRRFLSEPARARGRLAQPARRRASTDRCAGRSSACARRGARVRCAGGAGPHGCWGGRRAGSQAAAGTRPTWCLQT